MAKLLATDGEGERLDRFELVAELASGGMATVFLARLSGVAGFQRLVAIKRLHPHLANDSDFIEMFLDEARLAARIHHPNVVPIQEVGESKSGYYLVMDYVEGDTLARLLARAAQSKTQIPWGVTVRILLDTLAGLHAAHELTDDLGQPLALVHRDVSPQNVLVGSDGIARITDFGVARAASRLATTRSGQLKGKLAYMAPEQARGEDVDRRADLFACGIVLWEALSLKRLFKGDGEAQTLNRVLFDPIAPPSTQRPGIPKGLEDVCMKALERDVDKRFRTAEEFGEELERVARGLSCVGSVRDVASCLEQVFGNDLIEQRDAVRAWLVRSEPSAQRSRKTLPESGQTRVEKVASEPSTPGSRSARLGNVDRFALTAPAPDAPGSLPPEKVSSVSSAILQVTEDTGAPRALVTRRSSAWVIGVVATLVVLLGVAAWGANELRGRATATSTSTSTTAEPPSTAVAEAPSGHAAASTHATPDTPPSASSPPAASAHGGTPPVGAAAPLKTSTKRPAPAPKPTATPTTAPTAPDDLSKNPYR